MSYINEEQKERIIALTNALTPNAEISRILKIPLQTIFYWKRALRKSGDIKTDSRMGRPQATYHTCETCGQLVKDQVSKKEIYTATERIKIIEDERNKEIEDTKETENKLKNWFGDEKPPEKNKDWNY